MKYKTVVILVLFICFALRGAAQTLPVGLLNGTDDLYRRQQLLGLDTSNSSLMVRPIFHNLKHLATVTTPIDEVSGPGWNKLLWTNKGGSAEIRVLPVVWQQQYNTHHPYGWNDGAMIPARGYQTSLSGGFFAKWGPLSVQLRPEYVFAENKDFTEFTEASLPTSLRDLYASNQSKIDEPERFGTARYSKVNWGQSSIRLTFDPVSIGLSNESLWWGPGVRNALVMSNNAPGFRHLTLNTTRPVKTPIGSFETQIIAGRLENSSISAQTGKRDEWRYLSGMVFSYHPKWIPGLHLGFDRTFSIYHTDLGNGFSDYFPILTPLQKKSFNNEDDTINAEDGVKRDQIFSLFARWVMPESKSEIYIQYGKEDHSWDLRDAIVEPEYSRAYVAGFRKLLPLSRLDEYIQVGIELTQMEPSGTSKVRGASSWYGHSQVKHGYTNRGQILGAGIGADNLQSLSVDWVKDLRRIGLMLERRVHDNGLYYRAFSGSKEFRRHWVDLAMGAGVDWDFKNLIINSQVSYIRSLNYQYQFENQSPTSIFVWDKQDVNNLQLKVGIMYRL